jgi:hypothetical protein
LGTLIHEGGTEPRKATILRGTDNAKVFNFQFSNSAAFNSLSSFTCTLSTFLSTPPPSSVYSSSSSKRAAIDLLRKETKQVLKT